MLHHNTVGIKEWRNIARDVLFWTTCSWHHSIGIRRKRLFNVHSFIFVSPSDQSMYDELTVIFTFPRTYCQYLRILSGHVLHISSKESLSDVYCGIERVTRMNGKKKTTWRYAQNVVLSKYCNTFANLIQPLLIVKNIFFFYLNLR
jgi:hypothetical protein